MEQILAVDHLVAFVEGVQAKLMGAPQLEWLELEAPPLLVALVLPAAPGKLVE